MSLTPAYSQFAASQRLTLADPASASGASSRDSHSVSLPSSSVSGCSRIRDGT
ncbi:hypothetical protein NUQ54_005129 [Salmonella enterica]|nr:hypothetical protein [Salmonella enterica]